MKRQSYFLLNYHQEQIKKKEDVGARTIFFKKERTRSLP